MVSKDQRAPFVSCHVCFLCNKLTIRLESSSFRGNFVYLCKEKIFVPRPPFRGLHAKITPHAVTRIFFPPPPPLTPKQDEPPPPPPPRDASEGKEPPRRPESVQIGGWRRLLKQLGAVTVSYKAIETGTCCHGDNGRPHAGLPEWGRVPPPPPMHPCPPPPLERYVQPHACAGRGFRTRCLSTGEFHAFDHGRSPDGIETLMINFAKGPMSYTAGDIS